MNRLLLVLLAATPATLWAAEAAAQTTRKPAAKPAHSQPAAARPAHTQAAAQPVPAVAALSPAPVAAPTPPASRATAAASDDPFEVGTNVVNLGIGLGSRYDYGVGLIGGSSSVSPAFSASYERGLLALGPGYLGVGAIVGYQGAGYDLGGGDKWHYSDVVVMVRGSFHYPVSPRFDAYGGLGLGVRYSHWSYDGSLSSLGSDGSAYTTSGLFVGGRYFFTPSIGAFAEVGYDQSFLKVGLSAKF